MSILLENVVRDRTLPQLVLQGITPSIKHKADDSASGDMCVNIVFNMADE